MSRRARKNYSKNDQRLNKNKRREIQAFENNLAAMIEGPQRKRWNIADLRTIKPKTPAQNILFRSFFDNNNVLAHGSAGSGKTFIAMYLAFNELLSNHPQYDNVIIVRTAVPTREIGFTPGTEEEKMAVYEQPYKDILHELFGRASTYEDMKRAGVVKFTSTSFIRGVTWDNAIVIFDEAQNANWEEVNTVLTRIGENSRLIVCGDAKQDDLIYKKNDKSGIHTLIKVAERMESFDLVNFTQRDIVRSKFVKDFIIACEDVGV